MTAHEARDRAPLDDEGATRRPAADEIVPGEADDGIDRRGFLRCMAWAGTAAVWGLSGGVPTSFLASRPPAADDPRAKSIFFAQISDSHIGFAREANPNVTATLQEAVARLNALPQRPAFVLHTGDITQLARPEEFDAADEVLRGVRTDRIVYVPGEHDVAADDGAAYLRRYGARSRGGGWLSFDHSGVHFVGLVNVLHLRAGGLGSLGAEQLAWLKRDLASLASSTPVVVFAHVPLWTVYPAWGWGTDDAEQALGLLRRFGSVTVLNGHIHQIMQKVEGHVSFHTAMSTAFPQPAPGTAPAPGPMKVEPERLRSVLGIADVTFIPGRGTLAVVDATLSGDPPAFEAAASEAAARRRDARTTAPLGPTDIGIDNFRFSPATLTVARGATVTWINRDDVPHLVASSQRTFKPSPVLDSDQRYSLVMSRPGTYDYFCSLHPVMQGRIVVT